MKIKSNFNPQSQPRTGLTSLQVYFTFSLFVVRSPIWLSRLSPTCHLLKPCQISVSVCVSCLNVCLSVNLCLWMCVYVRPLLSSVNDTWVLLLDIDTKYIRVSGCCRTVYLFDSQFISSSWCDFFCVVFVVFFLLFQLCTGQWEPQSQGEIESQSGSSPQADVFFTPEFAMTVTVNNHFVYRLPSLDCFYKRG